MVHDGDPVGQPEHDVHVVLDHDDGAPLLPVHGADHVGEAGHVLGADAGHRLVEQHAPPGRWRAGSRAPACACRRARGRRRRRLAVPASPTWSSASRAVRTARLTAVGPPPAAAGCRPGGPARRAGRSRAPAAREDARGLEGAAQTRPGPPVRRPRVTSCPSQLGPCPRSGSASAGEQVEQRRLARAVRPDDAEELAGSPTVEVDAVDDASLRRSRGQVAVGDGGLGARAATEPRLGLARRRAPSPPSFRVSPMSAVADALAGGATSSAAPS